jgi:hypothetical protein
MSDQTDPQDHFLETLMKHIIKTHPRASKEEQLRLFTEAVRRHIELKPALGKKVVEVAFDEVVRHLDHEFPKLN